MRHSDILKAQRLAGGSGLGGPLRYPDSIILWLRCDQVSFSYLFLSSLCYFNVTFQISNYLRYPRAFWYLFLALGGEFAEPRNFCEIPYRVTCGFRITRGTQ